VSLRASLRRRTSGHARAAASDARSSARLSSELDSLSRARRVLGRRHARQDGHTLFARAYGTADRATQSPNRLDTALQRRSINKIFTHVAIMQLAQQGKLGLDDTIDRYLPDYPKAKRQPHHDPDATRPPGRGGDVSRIRAVEAPARVRTMDDCTRWCATSRWRSSPDSRQRYSNGGFVLLGRFVANVSGEDYYDYVRRHIYAPPA